MTTERLKVTVIETREKSIQVNCYGKAVWLPRSQIESMKQDGNDAEIVIPFWLYKKHWD